MWTNKEAYILSKIYIDDFKYANRVNGVVNTECFCAIKSTLRIASTKKDEKLKYLVEKYSNVGRCFKYLTKELDSKAYKNFVDKIAIKDFKKACDYADTALQDVHSLDKKYMEDSTKIVLESDVFNYATYLINDYQKIVSSSAFRRMQDKSQLFVMVEGDFSRRRLTHSIEVSSIAEKISIVSSVSKFLSDRNLKLTTIDTTRVVARCSGVLHDIGNPPFGHACERTINNFFASKEIQSKLNNAGLLSTDSYFNDLLVFDGNAQSLRIATKLLSFDNKKGASLSAAVLGSIIKYPHGYVLGNNKKGYFLSEKEIIDDLETLGVYKEGYRNPFAVILEAADDLSYLVSDLEDSIHKGIITKDDFDKNFKDHVLDANEKDFFDKYTKRFTDECSKHKYYTNQVCFENVIKPLLFQFRENFITNIPLFEINNKKIFEYIIKDGVGESFELVEHNLYSRLFKTLKKVKKNIYSCDEITKAEKFGEECIYYLLDNFFNALLDCKIDFSNKKLILNNPNNSYLIDFLPNNLVESFFGELKRNDSNNKKIYFKMRLLNDYISGMTDTYAKKLFYTIKDTEKLKKA